METEGGVPAEGVVSVDPVLLLPQHQVSRRAISWWTMQALLNSLLVVVPLGVVAVVWSQPRPWFATAAVVAAVFGLGYTLVMPRWRFRVHRWEATDNAVYTSAGWLYQEWRVAPMSRIQTVDTARGPLQQLFGLASVTVTTASAAGPLRIDGLERPWAVQLAEQLTAVTARDPGDAT